MTTAVTRPRVKKLSGLKYLVKNRNMYIMLLPGVLFFLVFRYIPLAGNVMAFQDYNMRLGIFGSKWIGLGNLTYLFGTDKFLQVLRNSIVISLLKLLWGFPMPILLALLINELQWLKYKKFVQTSVYLPHFISWPIIGGLVMAFLSPTNGFVNAIIKQMGGKSIYFLAEPRYFRTILVVTDIWKDAGWGTIVYMAAIAGVNTELYEAAMVDGAGRFRQLVHITLPHLVPTIVVLLILRTGSMLENGFDQIFILYNTSVYEVGDVLETYIYRLGLVNAKYSLSTAAGMFQSVVGFVMILVTNRLAKTVSGSSIF